MARKKTRLAELREEAAERGMTVETWSPGDGVTRYRFFDIKPGSEADKEQTYYGPKDGVYTALGLKEAYAFLHYGSRRGGKSLFDLRRNPYRTREGRVLRTEGHSKHSASELLLARKKAKKSHKRLPRRKGRLTYQSAQVVLHEGRKAKRTRTRHAERAGYTTVPGKMDFFDYLDSVFK